MVLSVLFRCLKGQVVGLMAMDARGRQFETLDFVRMKRVGQRLGPLDQVVV